MQAAVSADLQQVQSSLTKQVLEAKDDLQVQLRDQSQQMQENIDSQLQAKVRLMPSFVRHSSLLCLDNFPPSRRYVVNV